MVCGTCGCNNEDAALYCANCGAPLKTDSYGTTVENKYNTQNSFYVQDGVGDITIRKHAFLRTLIVESSWVAIRQDPALTLAFETYCTRMKPSEAIIKIARKLVNRIYFVMKWQKPYVTSVVS